MRCVLAEMLNQVECTNETKLRMYQIWIEALRGGHAGQGLDIHGSDHLMPHAVETGDASKVEASVHCIHRLKTAFPARCLAQMGAIYGGGSDEEVEAIGVFFEATGLAFQIIDDVLNLRGLVSCVRSFACARVCGLNFVDSVRSCRWHLSLSACLTACLSVRCYVGLLFR
eukprot:COSAG01_NODE_228_length_21104_cov_210.303832_7_plen_170_part_00